MRRKGRKRLPTPLILPNSGTVFGGNASASGRGLCKNRNCKQFGSFNPGFSYKSARKLLTVQVDWCRNVGIARRKICFLTV